MGIQIPVDHVYKNMSVKIISVAKALPKYTRSTKDKE